MALGLAYRSSRPVAFHDGSYSWVDEATFDVVGASASSPVLEVLARLLVDAHYVNAYQVADRVAADVHDQPSAPTRHERYLSSLAEQGRTPETDPMRNWGPGLWRKANRPGPEHGPYVLSDITLETFDRLTGPQARQALIDWVLLGEPSSYPSPDEIDGDLDGILSELASDKVVFRLHDLGEVSEHEAGRFVQPYLELVAIDLDSRKLRLIAAGTD